MKSARKLKFGELHQSENWLRDVILGGQDGLVNVLGIVLGVAAASGDTRILIAASLSAAIAEAISMGAVAYTSTLAERDHYHKELQREKEEVEKHPDREREEIRQIYSSKGFSGKILEEVVATITKDKKVWISTMMEEDLGLVEGQNKRLILSSFVIGLAAAVGSIFPIVPFLLLPREAAIVSAVAISALVLFSVGVYEAKTFVGSWWKKGLQMALIGMGAAGVGYIIGKLFNSSF